MGAFRVGLETVRRKSTSDFFWAPADGALEVAGLVCLRCEFLRRFLRGFRFLRWLDFLRRLEFLRRLDGLRRLHWRGWFRKLPELGERFPVALLRGLAIPHLRLVAVGFDTAPVHVHLGKIELRG